MTKKESFDIQKREKIVKLQAEHIALVAKSINIGWLYSFTYSALAAAKFEELTHVIGQVYRGEK